jgi:hypothetical protein
MEIAHRIYAMLNLSEATEATVKMTEETIGEQKKAPHNALSRGNVEQDGLNRDVTVPNDGTDGKCHT